MSHDQNGHTNGRSVSPSQQAWITAKEQAVAEHEARMAENRQRGEIERMEMIRAVMDPHLSHGAARLFCFLLKAGWQPDMGGLYQGRVGSVMTDGRRLARYCGGASVNCLYEKVRHEKRDATGKILVHASVTKGWIQELVERGYIWIGKHRIANIPKSHWPNVYNVSCHVPEKVTPHLPWLDGGFGSENVINTTLEGGSSPKENRILRASSTPDNGQMAENTLGNHRNANRPVIHVDNGQSPQCQLANPPRGGLPITASDNGQSPKRITAQHRNANLPSTEKAVGLVGDAVDLGKTLDRKKVVNQQTEGSHPAPIELVNDALEDGDTLFADWCTTWDGEKRYKWEKEIGRLKALLHGKPSAFWKRRHDFLRFKLDGGKPPMMTAPARAVKPAVPGLRKMPLHEAAQRMKAAKAEAGL